MVASTAALSVAGVPVAVPFIEDMNPDIVPVLMPVAVPPRAGCAALGAPSTGGPPRSAASTVMSSHARRVSYGAQKIAYKSMKMRLDELR